MQILQCTRVFALALLAPAVGMSASSQGLAPAETAALHARIDPSLGSLRAGRADAPAPLSTLERSQLGAAQEHDGALAELRAGARMTDNEWTWLAIGAGIVLLIVLI
jgi:hypothetical protein